MASSNYTPYYYQNTQQSSAPNYTGYETAPAESTIPQSTRQYQQTPSIGTSQPADYMQYHSQSYNSSGAPYGGTQNNAWNEASYGKNGDTSSRAAEVLQNMSNNTYSSNTPAAASASGFTAMNVTNSARYSTGASSTHQQHPQQQSHVTHSSYGQTQNRPSSVNTNRASSSSTTNRGLPSPATATGYPSQRTQASYTQQQQRVASPALQYSHSVSTPVSSAKTSTVTAPTQYSDYNSRQLPSVDASRSIPTTATTVSYDYVNNQATARVPQAVSASNISEQYGQSTTTVDPMAVYDPWPEYQRKQAALRAQKATEEAARAEEDRKAEEAHKEQERKKAEMERANIPKAKMGTSGKQTATASGTQPGTQEPPGESSGLEAEMRAMMAKMRELNSKDPAMLARIWEEERRARAPKSPTVQSRSIPQPTAPPAAPQATQADVSQVADQRKTAVSEETHSKAAAPTVTSATFTPTPPPAPTAIPSRPSGNTIWPPEKKAQLARAAITYLSALNPSSGLSLARILGMLDGNVSYIELCERLEGMGAKLDRAAFAKNLLAAVPDVNGKAQAPRQLAHADGNAAQRVQVQAPPPVAVPRRAMPPSLTATPRYASAAQSSVNSTHYPSVQGESNISASPLHVPAAEMVPIKAELKPPANKEEAARKRNFNDLIDLTLLDDEDEPPAKRPSQGFGSPYAGSSVGECMDVNEPMGPMKQFRTTASAPSPEAPLHAPTPQVLPNDTRLRNIVQPLDKRNALRRNGYDIKTIARDVLLACGRHPYQRQLNEHLEALRSNLHEVDINSDLSTLRWDMIDPGDPPKGYFKEVIQTTEEDADDEEDSEAEAARPPRPVAQAPRGVHAPLPAAINPFKPRRRGRPPRNSFPSNTTTGQGLLVETPRKPMESSSSASASRPASTGVGYSAFRSAAPELGPDGKPLPKKRGRPKGWRKAIHGSASAQQTPRANGFTGPNQLRFIPSQPSTLRNSTTEKGDPIIIHSRSPSVAKKNPQYQSFKCRWLNCPAELHNLETLKKHTQKAHAKSTPNGNLECLWEGCGMKVASEDPVTNMRIHRHTPLTFTHEGKWREHLELRHFIPLSWELGDGPASGLSGKATSTNRDNSTLMTANRCS